MAPLYVLTDGRMGSYADFQNTQGIIFVVDSNDRERIPEAREELQRMLNEDELRDALLLVFANKQDLPNAMNAAEITDKLGLHSLRQRQWYVHMSRTATVLLFTPFSPGPILRLYRGSGLSLSFLCSISNTFRFIQATCATSGDGLYEGLEWVCIRQIGARD